MLATRRIAPGKMVTHERWFKENMDFFFVAQKLFLNIDLNQSTDKKGMLIKLGFL